MQEQERSPLNQRTTMPRLHPASFGLLCGQVWSWELTHRIGAGTTAAGFPLIQPVPLLYLALSACMLAAMAVSLVRRPSAQATRWVDLPAALVAIPCTVILAYPPATAWATSLARAIPPICCVFGGIAFGWMYLQWAFFYARLDTRGALACVFGTIIFGSLLKIPLDLLPALPACLLCAALPPLSAILRRSAEDHQPRARAAETYYTPHTLRSFLKLAIGVAAYGLVIGITHGMPVEAAYAPKWALTASHHVLEALVAGGALWFVVIKNHGLQFSQLWRAVLVFTATGVLAIPLFGAYLSGWALVAVAVAQTLVVALLWATLADVARHTTISPLAIFGCGWVIYSLPLPVGMALGGLLFPGAITGEVVAAFVYVLAMASVFLLNDRDFSRSRLFTELDMPLLPQDMYDIIERVCQTRGRQAGLTDREIEIMAMLCRGRTKGFIAEALSISENTVRTHTRHLYTKLGIHSRQDLLTLVACNDEGERRA